MSVLIDGGGALLDCFLQVIEDDPIYWEVILSALAVGWLEIVVCSFCSPVLLFYQFLSFLLFGSVFHSNKNSDKKNLISSSCAFTGEIAEVTWILSTRSARKS